MRMDRRVALLDAAERVIGERGAAATTIADLTNAAGVAKGTFYLYFDSKEALFDAVQARWIDELIERTAASYDRLRGEGDWWIPALMLYAAVKQLLHHAMQQDGPVDRERMVRASRELVHKALALP